MGEVSVQACACAGDAHLARVRQRLAVFASGTDHRSPHGPDSPLAAEAPAGWWSTRRCLSMRSERLCAPRRAGAAQTWGLPS